MNSSDLYPMKRKKTLKKNNISHPRNLRNQGQSMVELLAILTAMSGLILVTIQFALIWHAKITLNYATFEAVRAGTLNNATFDAVKEGFSRGLAPLYSYDKHDKDQVGAFQEGRDRVWKEFDAKEKLVRIERLNPTDQAFADFADDEGYIPNDNLRFRSSTVSQHSRSSLQDANLLHLRVTYWYPMYVPFVNKLIFKKIICRDGGKWKRDPVCGQEIPKIPLTTTSVMRMQSPPKKDSNFFDQTSLIK